MHRPVLAPDALGTGLADARPPDRRARNTAAATSSPKTTPGAFWVIRAMRSRAGSDRRRRGDVAAADVLGERARYKLLQVKPVQVRRHPLPPLLFHSGKGTCLLPLRPCGLWFRSRHRDPRAGDGAEGGCAGGGCVPAVPHGPGSSSQPAAWTPSRPGPTALRSPPRTDSARSGARSPPPAGVTPARATSQSSGRRRRAAARRPPPAHAGRRPPRRSPARPAAASGRPADSRRSTRVEIRPIASSHRHRLALARGTRHAAGRRLGIELGRRLGQDAADRSAGPAPTRAGVMRLTVSARSWATRSSGSTGWPMPSTSTIVAWVASSTWMS